MSTKQENNESEIDYELYQKIQPLGGISFKDESVVRTGDGFESCLHVAAYPVELENFWLANLTNINNTVAIVDISNEDVLSVKKNINHSMKEQNVRYGTAKDYTTKSEAEQKYMEMKELVDEINSMHEVMKVVDSRIYVTDRSWLQLDEKVKNIKDKLDVNGYRSFINLNESKSDWSSMYQSYTEQQQNQYSVEGQPLTSSAVAGGNPFHYSCLEDKTGTFFGSTPTYGNVLFDMFAKTGSRKFYNSLAVGTMGAGKSTLLKKIFEDRAIRGDYVRAFDISGEFAKLTESLGGRIVKLDGTDKNALNALEILRAGDGVDFARHITKLNTMYRFLVPDATQEEVTEFSNTINELYEEFSLTPKEGRTITGKASSEYPIFSDLNKFIDQKMINISNGTYNDVDIVVAQNEIKLLDKINKTIVNLIRTYGKIFNVHTSMNNILDEQIITFDISALKDMDSNIFDAQIFNIVSLCWDNCVSNGKIMYDLYHNKKEISFDDIVHFVILIDESHRWINAQKLQSLNMITVYMREARKYFGGIILASQSIRDYVPEGSSDIAINKLKTLFELTQYKFIFYQDSNALPVLENVFGNVLTVFQLKRIPKLEMGSCILSISSDFSLEFNVYITDEEEYLFSGGV